MVQDGGLPYSAHTARSGAQLKWPPPTLLAKPCLRSAPVVLPSTTQGARALVAC